MSPNITTSVAAVLQHSDRYLLELVERWDICPFARRCREDGRLWRRIIWPTTAQDAADRMDAAIDALESKAMEGMPEVALLLCPGLQHVDARAFNEIYVAARARYQTRHPKPAFYVVAFHPTLRLNANTPASLVNFWRRSPHPTLQFVSVALLARLRQVDRIKDPNRIALEMAGMGATAEEIGAALEQLREHLPVSERVAEHNWETFTTEGAEVFIELQEDIAALVARDTATIGPWQARWPDTAWLPTSG